MSTSVRASVPLTGKQLMSSQSQKLKPSVPKRPQAHLNHSYSQPPPSGLQSRTTDNNVTINDTKTTVMYIDTSSVPITHPIVSINNSRLQVVQSTKSLGITTGSIHTTHFIRSSTFKLFLLPLLKTLGTFGVSWRVCASHSYSLSSSTRLQLGPPSSALHNPINLNRYKNKPAG